MLRRLPKSNSIIVHIQPRILSEFVPFSLKFVPDLFQRHKDALRCALIVGLVDVQKGRFLEEVGIITRLPYVFENDNFLCSMKMYWVPNWFEHKLSTWHIYISFFFSLTNFSKWKLVVQKNLQTLCSTNLARYPIKSHSTFCLLKAWAHYEVHQEAHEHANVHPLFFQHYFFFLFFFSQSSIKFC